MMILVSNTKGGVGKSTIAVHLAVWLFDRGIDVAVVDTDLQETTGTWLPKVEASIPLFVERDPKAVVSLINRLKQRHQVVVCDTAGDYGFLGTLLPSLADLALIPLEPSDADVDELDKALFHIQVSQQARGKPDARLIFSKTASNDAKAGQLRTLLANVGVPVTKNNIRRLTPIRNVAKKSAVMRERTKKARVGTSDFDRLFSEVLHGWLPITRRKNRRRAANG